MTKYQLKAQSGKLTVWAEEPMIISSFEGNINETLIYFLNESLSKCLAEFKTDKWVYVSYSNQAKAATPGAYKMLVQSAKDSIASGCVAAAYVLDSAIAKDQTKKMRAELGLPEPFEDVLFDTLEEAKDSVLSRLRQH
ncbi:hypothetical protein ACSLBF_20435 (plasmid) [Pseudoalteromonas sp. T1lg65]|uniref:hypothetical protein n=1 Tax=Pseudoalteromonas sp. T1lg65 TaxID=2077101 RepID=UPI003F7A87E1